MAYVAGRVDAVADRVDAVADRVDAVADRVDAVAWAAWASGKTTETSSRKSYFSA
ncbi:MAG: hypothetical protein AB7D36_07915 [Oscillospiraceae bacterium]